MDQLQSAATTQKPSTLRPVGDLTIFEALTFHAELLTLHQQDGPLQLDLTDVTTMDSSCVQLTVAATRSGRLTLRGYSVRIRDKFEQIGFAKFLPNQDFHGKHDNPDLDPT
jgi:anti-anti-sigma regulatory factor